MKRYVLTANQALTYAVVCIKPGVCVLALDGDRYVHLNKKFHYAVGHTTIECVSGGREDQEQAMAAARRELHGELGIEAENWFDLGRLVPFTAFEFSPTALSLWHKTFVSLMLLSKVQS